MNGEGFSRQWFQRRYGKKIDRIHDASVLGKEPSGSSLAGDVRREQVAYGVTIYRPQSRHDKGVSFMRAAKMAINNPQFKDIDGAYTLPEAKTLSRAIERAYKRKRFDFAT